MTAIPRAARGAVVALALVLAAAAPAAAAGPTYVRHGGYGAWDLPAGTACAFDVEGSPNNITMTRGVGIRRDLDDGTVVHFTHAKGAYVNLDTGAQYPTEDIFTDVSKLDPTTNILVGLETGQSTWSFLPGDQGPYGVVGENGAMYHIIGTLSYTYDLNDFQVLRFSFSGSAEDVCAALS